jgi:hypothetical protein
MKKVIVGLAILFTFAALAHAQDEPHPWCHTLQIVVPDNDSQAIRLAEAFMTQLESAFDLKGYVITQAEAIRIPEDIAENLIDFAILPEEVVDSSARGEVLWSCCNDVFRFRAVEHGYISHSNPAELARLAQHKGRGQNYAIVASPQAFEMGYAYRTDLFQAAEESLADWE